MRPNRRWALHATMTAIVAALWLVSTEPWGLRVGELLPFTGPGATLGVTTAWLAFAADQRYWSWRAGLWGALLGAGLLPPFLAFMIALAGTAPQAALTPMFVAFSWVALAAGSATALLRLLFTRTHTPRRLANAWRTRRAAMKRRRNFVPIHHGSDP